MRRFLSIILVGTLALGLAACSKEPAPSTSASENTEVTTDVPADEPADNSDDKFVSAYPAFKVTSESLDGKYWIDDCVFQGGNASPQLSWEPVEGATTYVITSSTGRKTVSPKQTSPRAGQLLLSLKVKHLTPITSDLTLRRDPQISTTSMFSRSKHP